MSTGLAIPTRKVEKEQLSQRIIFTILATDEHRFSQIKKIESLINKRLKPAACWP
jgi:hypothetical protein